MATVSAQERARIMGKFTVSLRCPAFLQYRRIIPVVCPRGTGCQYHLQLMKLVHVHLSRSFGRTIKRSLLLSNRW